jgi:hypothetical protein
VALLIMKMLQKLNLLCEDSFGGELNIIFDNCPSQNKKNTVLKLPAWLMAMGYFKGYTLFSLWSATQKMRLTACLTCSNKIIGSRICSMFDELVWVLDTL